VPNYAILHLWPKISFAHLCLLKTKIVQALDYMRHLYLTILAAAFLMTSSLSSCKQKNKADDKILTEKEQSLGQKDIIPRSDKQTTTNTISNELSFLNAFDKKYPYEIKLLDKPVIKRRLEEMLGPQYAFVKSIWEVETPIAITNGIFYAWGMKAHSGGDPGAVLMADLNKNVLYVGIRKNKDEKFYSEDGSMVPQKMQEWADEQ
tara:strand:+ start:687 stop:1301 length:615 start_codon:yes stop_codon:yes gene_type:complete